jgi:3',5'-cyclic AMP phosphodiesterase CpdA
MRRSTRNASGRSSTPSREAALFPKIITRVYHDAMPICFVSDLHLGRDRSKSWAEPCTAMPMAEIVTRLKHVVVSEKVDLLVLGGDQIEHGSLDHIDEICDLMKLLAVPTMVCMGNHDLTMPGAQERWRAAIARWPDAKLADCVMSGGEIDVIGMNTQWIVNGNTSGCWTPGVPCCPAVTMSQRAWLRETVGDLSRPAFLVLHTPLHLQSPGENPHGTTAVRTQAYRDAVEAELMRSGRPERVVAILSGHIHFPSIVHGQRTMITNAAVCEQPSLVRVIGYHDGRLAIRNIAL